VGAARSLGVSQEYIWRKDEHNYFTMRSSEHDLTYVRSAISSQCKVSTSMNQIDKNPKRHLQENTTNSADLASSFQRFSLPIIHDQHLSSAVLYPESGLYM
jgi:hypothetical protein